MKRSRERGSSTADAVAIQTFAYPDPEALAEAARDLAVASIEKALEERGRACIVLAGGSTPRAAYALMARAIREKRLAVDRILWAFGDERWVPLDDERSNERMARQSLLTPIGAPPKSVLSWGAGSGEPVECARRYDATISRVLQDQGIDLVFLGMGADGHTASLFPDGVVHLGDGPSAPVSPDITGSAAAVRSETAGGWRLTLTPRALNASRLVAFLVEGEAKAAAFSRARAGDPRTPAAWIRAGETRFLVARNALGPENVNYGRDIRHA